MDGQLVSQDTIKRQRALQDYLDMGRHRSAVALAVEYRTRVQQNPDCWVPSHDPSELARWELENNWRDAAYQWDNAQHGLWERGRDQIYDRFYEYQGQMAQTLVIRAGEAMNRGGFSKGIRPSDVAKMLEVGTKLMEASMRNRQELSNPKRSDVSKQTNFYDDIRHMVEESLAKRRSIQIREIQITSGDPPGELPE